MSAEQFGEVLGYLVLLAVLSGMAGAILWGLIDRLIFVVIDLIGRRLDSKVASRD